MIRKLKSGGYRLYSKKVDPKTGKRRNLGTFKTRARPRPTSGPSSSSSAAVEAATPGSGREFAMATEPDRRSRGCLVGLGVLVGVIVCTSLGAAYTAADGQGPATGAVDGAACGVVLGALAGSILARRPR